MSTNKPKILFFTPFATRTGSEMLLLHILRRIDRNLMDIGLASFADGELLKEFPKDIPIFLVPRKFNLFQKVLFHLGINPTLRYLRKIAKSFEATIWYVNTTMLPEAVKVAKETGISVITHFHELPLSYIYLSDNDMQTIIKSSDLIIGCSETTCKAICDAGGLHVKLLYSFIDPDRVKPDDGRSEFLRNFLNIPKDNFVWVLSGMTSERKGFDLLPEIAEALDDPKVSLVWIGNRIPDGLVYYTEQRILNSSTKTKVYFTGKQTEDYINYLNMGDGFLLTSRQDPFPLVMIESALLGLPIVAFPSGGASEFIEKGMGIVTQDISVKQMVLAMKQIMSKEYPINIDAIQARAQEFNVEKGYKNWLNIIEENTEIKVDYARI